MESSSVLAAVVLLWQLPRRQGLEFRGPDPGCPVRAALLALAQLVHVCDTFRPELVHTIP